MIDAQILAALTARAAELLTANGYHTDAGANIYQGRVLDLMHDTVPALVITQPPADSDIVTDDEVASAPQMTSEFVVEGYLHADPDNPLPDVMRLRADLIRCFYRPGVSLRPGLPRSADLPDGLGIEGCESRLVSTAKVMPDPGSTVAMAQITLRIEYIQPISGD